MKKIGIVGYPVGNGFGIPVAYLQFFSNFGVVSIIMPNETEIREELDLLVLPGGPDVDTSRYLGERPLSLMIGTPCPFRERFDNVLLPKYVKNQTPIFGICRGHQSLAVFFGGKLKQHMYHETTPSGERNKLVHFVKHTDYTPVVLEGTSSLMRFEVNSLHHQTVFVPPNNSEIIATYDGKYNDKDKLPDIEALAYVNYPAFSVQWHPEEIWDNFSIKLINKLLQNE